MNQDKVSQKNLFERIKTFFTNLTRAQIIGFLAIVNLLLLFSAWLYVPVLSSLSDVPILGSAVSPYVNIPETVFSLKSTVSEAESTFNKVVDTFEVKEGQAEKDQQLLNELNLTAAFLGVDLKEYGISLDDIKIEEGNLLFDKQDVQKVRDVFAGVNGIIDPVVGGVAGMLILCFGFDLYAAVTALKKKKATTGTFTAFVIQGVFILVLFFGCLAVNTAVQKEIFFINQTITLSVWAWIILAISVVGFCLSLKEYRGNKHLFQDKDESSDAASDSENTPEA